MYRFWELENSFPSSSVPRVYEKTTDYDSKKSGFVLISSSWSLFRVIFERATKGDFSTLTGAVGTEKAISIKPSSFQRDKNTFLAMSLTPLLLCMFLKSICKVQNFELLTCHDIPVRWQNLCLRSGNSVSTTNNQEQENTSKSHATSFWLGYKLKKSF